MNEPLPQPWWLRWSLHGYAAVLPECPISCSEQKALCVFCVPQLGSVACSPVDCPITCTYPFHPDGECCPVCRGEWDQHPYVRGFQLGLGPHGPVPSAPADCNYEGRKVVNGQVFTLDDEPCTQCTCQVSWAWGRRGCPARDCVWPVVPLQNCKSPQPT